MPARQFHDCFAITTPGLERITAGELASLGVALGQTEPGGVGFQATLAQLYSANLHSRTASRILVRLGEFHARTFAELERHARRLPWEVYLAHGRAVKVSVTSRKSRLYHQDAVAERLRDAVERGTATERPLGAACRDPGARKYGEWGNEGSGEQEQLVIVRLLRDRCTVSVDSSGELLHRRGYRLATAKAPLRETLAAAMLLEIGWDGSVPLLDPMCGSGTIPIEAALIARHFAPGANRGFAFQQWPGYQARVWSDLLDQATAQSLDRSPVPILGSDRDAGAIEAATANAVRAGVAENISFRRAAISAIEPPAQPGWIVTNPPYGIRVGDRLKLRNLFAQLGNVVRQRCGGWHLAMLSAHRELQGQTRLALEPRFQTSNGGVRVRLVEGSV